MRPGLHSAAQSIAVRMGAATLFPEHRRTGWVRQAARAMLAIRGLHAPPMLDHVAAATSVGGALLL